MAAAIDPYADIEISDKDSPVQVSPPSTPSIDAKSFNDPYIQEAVETGVANKEAQYTQDEQIRKGAKALVYGMGAAAGMAAAPAAFASLGSETAAMGASALVNTVTGMATSLGLDLLGKEKRTPDELMQGAVTGAVINAAGSLVQPLVGRFLISSTFKGAGKLATANSKQARAAEEVLAAKGGTLSPGQKENASGIVKTIESYLRGSTFTGEDFAAWDEKNMDIVANTYKEMMEEVGNKTGPTTWANAMKSIIAPKKDPITGEQTPDTLLNWINITRKDLYNSMEQQAEAAYQLGKQAAPIDVKHLYQQMEQFKDVPEFEPAFKLFRKYLPEIEEDALTAGTPTFSAGHYKPITNNKQPLEIDVRDAIILKKQINEAIGSTANQGKFNVLSKNASDLSGKIAESFVSGGMEDVAASFILADKFMGTSAELQKKAFAKAFVTNVRNDTPEKLVKILDNVNNMPGTLRHMRELWELGTSGFGGKVAKAQIPSFEEAVIEPWRYHILAKAFTENTDTFDPAAATKVFNSYPKEIKQALFGDDSIEYWNKVVNAGQYLFEAKFADRVVPRMMESGLIATTMFQSISGQSAQAQSAMKTLAALGLTVTGIAKAFKSPKLSDMILRGIAAGPTSGMYVAAMQQLELTAINEMVKQKTRSPSALSYFTDTPRKMVEARQQKGAAVQ